MAELEFFKGSYENLKNVPIKEGQVLFTTGDKKRILLDIDNKTRAEITSSLDVIKILGEAGTKVEVDGVSYDTIEDALENAPAGSTIKLDSNYSEPITLTAGKEIVLDLNNNDIKNDEATPIAIAANAALTIKGKGTIECNKHGKAPLANNGGIVSLDDGGVDGSIYEKGNGYYTLFNHGMTTINGGIISCPGNYSSLIENGYYDYNSTDPNKGHVEGVNAAEPTLVINGGTIINDYTTIKTDDGAVTIVNGGNIQGYAHHVGKKLTITGGVFSTSNGDENLKVVKLNDGLNVADCYISGGTFETSGSSNITTQGDPKIEITGGKFNRQVPIKFIKVGYKQTLIDDYYVITREE